VRGAAIRRIYANDGEDLQAQFNRVCHPLHSATPGWAEESPQFLARMIRNPDVAAHYNDHEVKRFDPWSVLGAMRCRVLILASEDDPVCPLPVVEQLASRLPGQPLGWYACPQHATPSSATARTSPSPPSATSSPRSRKTRPPAEPL
jgi:pimeloyl-ACP methyl ester carboxylesterase